MIGKLAITTLHGYRVVACQTRGSIPDGLALTLVPVNADEAVDAPPYGEAQWAITHIQSGMRIGPGFERRGDAQRVAEALADLADWTLPAFALHALPDLPDEIAATLDTALTQLGSD